MSAAVSADANVSTSPQTSSETAANVRFEDLGLGPQILQAVKDAGYSTPTPIQAQGIPPVLKGRDIIGIAQTGTGKTASFTLPMIEILARGRAKARMPRTLILEPTRELAAQVAESFEKYGKHHKLSMALLIGGVSFDDQDKKLDRGVDVLIATPGRLLDHFERGKLMLSGVQVLVIDEADRMLDMGFIPDVERIAKLIPFTRQTLFYSATMPPEIQRLTDQFLQAPVRIEVSKPATAATTITQMAVSVPADDWAKREALRAPGPRRGREERDRLLQPQARRGYRREVASEARLLGRCAAWRSRPIGAHARRWTRSARAISACSSRATSRPAASTFRRSATSSISTCRSRPTITSTASAAPAARDARAMHSCWSPAATRRASPRSKN